MTKRAKLLISLAGIIAFVVMIQLGFYLYSQSQVKNIQRQEGYAFEVYDQINQLYIEKSEGFLQEDVTAQDIDTIHSAILNLEQTISISPSLIAAYNDAHKRYYALNEVNSMHENPAIVGDLVTLETSYVEGLSSTVVQQIVNEYYFENIGDSFQESINLILDTAQNQTEKFEMALQELEQLEHIPIESGYYKVIANGMKDAENIYAQVRNETFVAELNTKFTTYAVEFMAAVDSEFDDISNSPELLAAIEISPYIKRLLVKQ